MTTLEEIKAKAKGETDALIEAAYFAGLRAGKQLAKVEILNLLTTNEAALDNWKEVAAPTQHDIKFEPTAAQVEEAADRVMKRAPKGLTKRVLKQVFNQNPNGLKTEEVQDAAVEIDERISRKTVYNELYRRTDVYTKGDDGLWRPVSQVRGGNASWTTAHQGGVQ